MTRERMQTLGLVLGVNLTVTALFVATRVWLVDRAPANSVSAAPMPTLMLDEPSAAEMFPPLVTYREEIWDPNSVTQEATPSTSDASGEQPMELMPPMLKQEFATKRGAFRSWFEAQRVPSPAERPVPANEASSD